MKNLNEKKICAKAALSSAMVVLTTASCYAASVDFGDVVQPVVDLLNSLLKPLLMVVGAVGALYCILIGVKYARAEEPQDREKSKAHLKGAITGFILIFVLIVVLDLLMPVLTDWAAQYQTVLL